MFKLLYYLGLVWNLLMLRLTKSQYKQLPYIAGFIRMKGTKGKIRIGKNVVITSSRWINPVGLVTATYLCTEKNGVLEIGDNVGISNSLLFARSHIIIEDDVLIGGGCQILDNDFHSLDYKIRSTNEDQNNVASASILIKKGAFIGTGSIVLKGVEIGEQSIVAAGSVVAKNIPSFEVWGGNPARFIRKIID